MPYTALPDRRMPYDNDGSVVCQGTTTSGITEWCSNAVLLTFQGTSFVDNGAAQSNTNTATWAFFPETREVTGHYYWGEDNFSPQTNKHFVNPIQGSTDSLNGLDGTWETASLPSGQASYVDDYSWRSGIKPISFTGPKRVVRFVWTNTGGGRPKWTGLLHIYGEKAAGQTPDDVIYINHDDTPGVEYTACEDFGDQPLGTTVVRQFRVKNTSASKTANTINIQCNDADFAISSDGTNWVTTINIASLAAGAESATMYVRCTTPAVGTAIGPRFNRIITTVASYT